MPQRSCSALQTILVAGGVGLLFTALLSGQTPTTSTKGGPVFQANARIVVLDVVVTGSNHQPLRGLQKQDFRLLEDGQPQTITHFEEHAATPPSPPDPSSPQDLPDMFSNVPRIAPAASATVLVFDSLNTPLADQSKIRAQMMKYLKKPEQVRQVAIFTLGTRLRLLQGFTDDPALLAAALEGNRKPGSNHKNEPAVSSSPLLQTSTETGANQEVVAALREHSEEAAESMQQFLAEQSSALGGERVKLTLEALQELARSVTGISGRKNVLWFSAGFPVVIFPDPALRSPFDAQRTDGDEIRKTDALLASAHIAIYPVAAGGIAADSLYDAGNDPRAISRQPSRQPDAEERSASHAAMDEIALDTGGTAFYGSNSLADVMHRIAAQTSDFYTLVYTSTNQATDGRFRKIEVELPKSPGCQLAYRRGYYADIKKTALAAAAPANPGPEAEPLSALLRPGLPDSTQVPLTLRVVRGMTRTAAPAVPAGRGQAGGSADRGGDNLNLKPPITRYQVDFLLPARGLFFDPSPDGQHHVRLEFGLVVLDQQGNPVNWMLREVNLNLNAARYAAAQTNGVNLYLEIDSPADGKRLRGGVYDLTAHLAGTVDVPLSLVTSGMTASAR